MRTDFEDFMMLRAFRHRNARYNHQVNIGANGQNISERGNRSQRGSLTTSNNIVTSPHLPVRNRHRQIIVDYDQVLFPARRHGAVSSHSDTAVQLNPQRQQTVTSKVTKGGRCIRQRKEQFAMKIRHVSVLVILSLLGGHSTRAADWEVVASPNAGRQANSLSSVAAVADNDVWAVGWAFNPSLNAYRTVTEHWNGTRWSLVRSPNATNGYNLLNGVGAVAANDIWTVSPR